MNNVVYIYGLVCPIENKVMYVGKADNVRRRLRQHIRESANGNSCAKSVWIRGLQEMALAPSVIVIEECSFNSWQEKERYWISHYKSVNPDLKNSMPGVSKYEVRREREPKPKLKTKNLQLKLMDGDKEILNTLCAMYGGLDRTDVVRKALRHMLKTKPKFVIGPRSEHAKEE